MLQSKGLDGNGAWVPNWQFDAICLSESVAETVRMAFDVELRPVEWRGNAKRAVFQIVAPSVGDEWFDEAVLRVAAVAVHGVDGARCSACGVWGWMPLAADVLPPPRIDLDSLTDIGVAASPEWFGDGCQAFRELRVRRDLAELLCRASPRDFALT